tara:strand:+ start:802 stop:951 length:150 start_codon:yes stop_codon:yes gene_type:complete
MTKLAKPHAYEGRPVLIEVGVANSREYQFNTFEDIVFVRFGQGVAPAAI